MFIAEREGFEPPVPLSTTVFKTVVIDHSTISPLSLDWQALCSKASAKVRGFNVISKFFGDFFQKKCVFLVFELFWRRFKEDLWQNIYDLIWVKVENDIRPEST